MSSESSSSRRSSSALLRAGVVGSCGAAATLLASTSSSAASSSAFVTAPAAQTAGCVTTSAAALSLRGAAAARADGLPSAEAGAALCGGSRAASAARLSAKDCLQILLVAGASCVGMAAAARRRRRKAPPASDSRRLRTAPNPRDARITDVIGDDLDDLGFLDKTAQVDGKEVSGAAAEAAMALNMTDQELRKRKYMKRVALATKPEDLADDALEELLAFGGDPDLFNIPYIWIQLGHIILCGTSLILRLSGDEFSEFAAFDLSKDFAVPLKSMIDFTLVFNFALACATAYEDYEENKEQDERYFWAGGWFVKVLVIGGVGTWQRNYQKAKEKEMREQKEMEMQLRKQGAMKNAMAPKLKSKSKSRVVPSRA